MSAAAIHLRNRASRLRALIAAMQTTALTAVIKAEIAEALRAYSDRLERDANKLDLNMETRK